MAAKQTLFLQRVFNIRINRYSDTKEGQINNLNIFFHTKQMRLSFIAILVMIILFCVTYYYYYDDMKLGWRLVNTIYR